MFDDLKMAPPDPILGLSAEFRQDPSAEKINLAVGVYKDEQGQTPTFATVSKVEKMILAQGKPKTYLPIEGSPEYAAAVQGLLFGEGHALIAKGRTATLQTPGGTGACRVAGELIAKSSPAASLWVSKPTWSNHFNIFRAAGIAEIKEYPYYDAERKCLDFEPMLEALEQIPEGDIILLHGCCHNPSGMDPTIEQWHRIAELIARRRLLPLIDFAYQGLGRGLDEDAAGVRLVCEAAGEALIANSFSKNFGLYCDRVGGMTIVGRSPESTKAAFSHAQGIVRANYSNPPAHGGAIVSAILSDAGLRAEWEAEVATVRERIQQMRQLFVELLAGKGANRDFSFITEQNGMFSFSGLNKEQVAELRDKHAIYIVGSGRINVAAMTPANADGLCQAIVNAL